MDVANRLLCSHVELLLLCAASRIAMEKNRPKPTSREDVFCTKGDVRCAKEAMYRRVALAQGIARMFLLLDRSRGEIK
jgi:hypothetical protein